MFETRRSSSFAVVRREGRRGNFSFFLVDWLFLVLREQEARGLPPFSSLFFSLFLSFLSIFGREGKKKEKVFLLFV